MLQEGLKAAGSIMEPAMEPVKLFWLHGGATNEASINPCLHHGASNEAANSNYQNYIPQLC